MQRRALGHGTLETVALALASRPGLTILDGDGRSPHGDHSYVACDPVAIFEADPAAPLDVLEALGAPSGDDAPFPRDVGYVAYDAAFPGRTLPGALPLARFARYDAVVRVDERRGEVEILGVSREAVERLEAALRASPRPLAAPRVDALAEDDPEAHLEAIARALEHISAGDVYQLNLTRRWTARFSGEPLPLYLAMREVSPVPLGFFQALDRGAILARTMETFLHFDRRERALRTRPIKGTRARSGDDAATAAALRADPKEHAEHSMIVDLMRNDLGRVAKVGSVHVEAPFLVEDFARLQHLVSVVRAEPREDATLRAIFEATFPPGSVTGTPKRRAMQRIDELESCRRGVYCGAVGHVRHDGSFHFAVAIRTALVAGGELHYHAGGGIVAGSQPLAELEETRLKARVLFDALARLAERASG